MFAMAITTVLFSYGSSFNLNLSCDYKASFSFKVRLNFNISVKLTTSYIFNISFDLYARVQLRAQLRLHTQLRLLKPALIIKINCSFYHQRRDRDAKTADARTRARVKVFVHTSMGQPTPPAAVDAFAPRQEMAQFHHPPVTGVPE